jgi:hypothetical protein
MKLRIDDIPKKYAGKGVVVVNPKTYEELGRAEYVAVNGFVFSLREDPAVDVGKIALDGIDRRNVGKAIGDKVTVVPTVRPQPARKVVLAPIAYSIRVDSTFIEYVKNRFITSEQPLSVGQLILIPVLGRPEPFKVIEADPSPCIMTKNTELIIMEEVWTPPPPPPKGFEKKLPTWSKISEEEGLKIEEEMTYRIKIRGEGKYYFTNGIEVKGSFVEFTPKLLRDGDEWYKPSFDKKMLLPSDKIDIIEDPPFKRHSSNNDYLYLIAGLTSASMPILLKLIGKAFKH